MSPRRVAGVSILAGLAAACVHEPGARFRDPDGRLERALFLVERDLGGGRHPLSARPDDDGSEDDGEPAPVVRVPDPAPVDVNSSITIEPRTEALGASADPAFADRIGALRREIEAAEGLVKVLEENAEARLADLERAEALLQLAREGQATSEERLDLERRIDAVGELEDAILDAVDALWPEGTPEGDRVDALLVRLFENLPALYEMTDAHLADLEERYRTLEADARRQGERLTLRLEAFLDAPGSDPVALHLPGYDELAEGHVNVVSRHGLALSELERERLREAVEASAELALAAERLRRGEASLEEAFRDVHSELLVDFRETAAEIERLLGRLVPERVLGELEAARADLEAEARVFLTDARAELGERAEELALALDALRRALEADAAPALARLVALLERGRELEARLRDAGAADLLGLAADAAALLADARAVLSDLAREGPALGATLEATRSIEDWLARVARESDPGAELQRRWRESRARAILAELESDLGQARELVLAVLRAAGVLREAPAPLPPRVPEVLDVDLARAPATRIDLLRAPRSEGDLVRLRATLSSAGQPLETSESSFRVTRFGHHARLSPSVVLVEADQLVGASDDGGFSPSLSWMHSWTPRPERDDWWADLHRVLAPSAGLHAAFLNYSVEDEFQIGLGVTLAIWKNRLQLGAGIDLQADSDEEGRYYSFVGSDLFALLQDFQHATEPRGAP